jgi:iron complex transport system ATP-binding protein
MLNIENLSVRFGEKQVLQNVSFSLRPNRLTALVGRNGAGKSTLLGCVNRQIAYTGTISVGERDLVKMAPRERARAIAILPQSLPAPHITGREMVALGRNPYLDFTGRLRETDKEAVEAALRAADALELSERYVDTLSGGEKQRIALAMILAQNTPVALLDEPTAHMDLGYEAAFLELLQRLKREQDKTFLVILHDLTQAVRYADDLIVLDGGKLVFAGSREECLSREIIEKTFSLKRYTHREDGCQRIFFSAE